MTPVEAAGLLKTYLSNKGANRGSKKAPSAVIKAAQSVMGIENADGVMGPKTEATMKALLSAPPAPEGADPASIVANLSPAAKEQAAGSLRDFANGGGGSYDDLIARLSATIAPGLAEISKALETRMLQTQATSESNALMREDERWSSNAVMQTQILDAIAELAQRVTANDKISKRVYQAYGIRL